MALHNQHELSAGLSQPIPRMWWSWGWFMEHFSTSTATLYSSLYVSIYSRPPNILLAFSWEIILNVSHGAVVKLYLVAVRKLQPYFPITNNYLVYYVSSYLCFTNSWNSGGRLSVAVQPVITNYLTLIKIGSQVVCVQICEIETGRVLRGSITCTISGGVETSYGAAKMGNLLNASAFACSCPDLYPMW